MDDGLQFGVLGPVRAVAGCTDQAPGGGRQRRLLSMLVLYADATVSADALCDAIWPGDLPAEHRAALHTQVFRLRRALPAARIERDGTGYRLVVASTCIDASRFESAVAAASSQRDSEPAAALALLDEAIGMWRGTPFDELGDVDDARIESDRLAEVHLRAVEERYQCALLLGRHGVVLADLDAFASRHPLRERPQRQLMSALRSEGRVADALAVYDRYRRTLAEELGIEPSPDIAALNDEIVRNEPAGEVLHPAPGNHRNAGRPRVARWNSSFVGREQLTDTVAELVARDRMVTLIGTGGVGKTRLASEVAERIGRHFRDGVWFCALADSEPGGVALAVCTKLGIEQRAGEHPVERISDVLDGQDALLVLDNCEHVIDEVAELAESLLFHAPAVSLLATSRERLNVDGERLCPVPPLPEPADADAGHPAIRLFVDRATAVRPGWSPTAEELESVAYICRRLSGLPLALELAAARLQAQTLDEVRAGLDSQIRLLTGGRRTVDRHRSVAAAIGWSHDLLTDDERDLFDAVSVFRAHFTADGAAAVANMVRGDTVQSLSGLVERSMLHRVGSRYGVLEPLREFGRMRLVESGLVDRALGRHARHMTEAIEGFTRDICTPRAHDAIAEIDRSLPDVYLALQTLESERDVGALLGAVDGLHPYGLHRMRHEVLGWARVAAEQAIDAGYPPDRIADAYASAAFGAWKRGDLERCADLTDHALEWSRRAGVEATAMTADALSTFTLIQGRLDAATHWTSLAEDLWTAAGDELRAVEAEGVGLLALAYAGEDASDRADGLVGRFADGDASLMSVFACYVAGEVVVESAPDLALRRLRIAVDRANRCGSTFVEGIAGSSLASLEARHGDPAAAVAHYRWLLPHWRRAGAHSLAWTTLRSVAELLVRLDSDRAAAVLLGAVASTGSGHEVFGSDAARLDALGDLLRRRVGDAPFERARAEGSRFSDGDATAFALNALAGR